MKLLVPRVVIPSCALIFTWGLSAQIETHTLHQEGVATARQISIDIQPFGPDDGGWSTLIGLEGLSLVLKNGGDSLVLDDGLATYAWPGAADGWYRLDIVKRYLSQDLEISVDGIPVFLSSPTESLDMFLTEDQLAIAGGIGPGVPTLASFSVRNLDDEPRSILDWWNPGSGSHGSKDTGLEETSSSASGSQSYSVAAEESPTVPTRPEENKNEVPSAETGEESSSRLFTPLF